MASNSARIFFAGMGTTFLILGVGFAGGLFMANSALKEPAYQAKSRVEQAVPARVVLPTTAQAAEASNPPEPVQQVAAVEPVASPPHDPVKIQPEKKVEKIDIKKAEREVLERRKRYAERKARREAARARQQMEPRIRADAPVMAFGSDEPQRGFGFFGN